MTAAMIPQRSLLATLLGVVIYPPRPQGSHPPHLARYSSGSMLKKRPKSVCKPDPVQPDLAARPDDHSSRPGVAAGLKRPTRPACPEGHESGPLSSVPLLESSGDGAGPIWPCSGWGLPSRHVTMPLVRSYRTISPLPTGPFRFAFAEPF